MGLAVLLQCNFVNALFSLFVIFLVDAHIQSNYLSHLYN